MLYIFNWASIAKQVMDILGRTNKVSLEVLGRVSLIWNDHLNAKTQVWFLPQPGTWQMRWWEFFLLTFNLCEYLTQALVNPFTRSLALALLHRDWCFLAISYTQRTSCSVKFPNFLSQISTSSKKPQELSVSNKEEYWENTTVRNYDAKTQCHWANRAFLAENTVWAFIISRFFFLNVVHLRLVQVLHTIQFNAEGN